MEARAEAAAEWAGPAAKVRWVAGEGEALAEMADRGASEGARVAVVPMAVHRRGLG